MSNRIPTEIEYLDQILGGGHIPSGTHGLFGPIGAGKTTLGVMIATAGALRQHERDLRGEPYGKWIFVGTQQPPAEIMRLAFSHVARIDRNVMEAGQLACTPQAHQYEIDRARDIAADGRVQSERDRFDHANDLLERYFSLVDRSGYRRFTDWDSIVKSIASAIHEASGGIAVAGVVLDYLSLLVQSLMDSPDNAPNQLSGFIRKSFASARSYIAQQFGCPLWLVHHIRPATARRSAAIPRHHDDAAECRHLGTELDACVCLGPKDHTTHCSLLTCTKGSAVKRPLPVTLEFDPNFASLTVARDFRLSSNVVQIVPTGGIPITCDPHTRHVMQQLIERRKR